MKEITDVIEESGENLTVKEYLSRRGFSATLVKRVKYGGIKVNGETVTVRYRLARGDRVAITLPEGRGENIPPIDIPLTVLYEDEYLVAVCKPRNMPTHPSRGNSLPTLANAVMARYGKGFVFRAVNRLDRGTSGVVLIARDAYTAAKMSSDMKAGKYQKIYHAVVEGVPSEPHGIIDAPIERESEGSIKRVVRADGKRAITEYELIEARDDTSLLKIALHTGRTHQIRVHMSYIGHPLYGDFLYGKRDDEGYLLHCSEIIFPHPISNTTVSVKSPITL